MIAMSRTQVTNADLESRDSVERELEERHAVAQDAFARRDLEGYRAMFSASLHYRRADGELIDCQRLMRDVASQFRRFNAVRSSFVREQLTVIGSEVIETVVQSATMDVTVFWVVHPRAAGLGSTRHRFAVQTLLNWYRRGLEIEPRLPTLSTYLGHVHVSDTYWYLSALPELMGHALDRLEKHWESAR
jgi:hypothetical protein